MAAGAALNSNIESLFKQMEGFVSSETVVGQPVSIGGVIIVPLVDVAFGLAAGTGESDEDKKKKDSGYGGIGAKITPSAVLVIMNGTVQLVNVKNQDSVNKLIDMVPGILSKFNLDKFFTKKEDIKPENKAGAATEIIIETKADDTVIIEKTESMDTE
jgi:uncharacterized spore protein YtfJ